MIRILKETLIILIGRIANIPEQNIQKIVDVPSLYKDSELPKDETYYDLYWTPYFIRMSSRT